MLATSWPARWRALRLWSAGTSLLAFLEGASDTSRGRLQITQLQHSHHVHMHMDGLPGKHHSGLADGQSGGHAAEFVTSRVGQERSDRDRNTIEAVAADETDLLGDDATSETANVTKHHPKPKFQFEPATWDILDSVKHVNAEGQPISTTSGMFQRVNETTGLLEVSDTLSFRDFGVDISYHYPSSAIALLPAEDASRYASCAVVGNSGGLLLKADGPFIDSHEAVFRINLAPVEVSEGEIAAQGYQEWVGEKSTYCIINSHNVKDLLSSAGHIRRARRDSRCEHMVLFETAASYTRHSLLKPMLQKFPGTVPLNPAFINQCFRVWAQAQELFSKKLHRVFQRKPMSGFYTVMMALQLCDSVDIFGFDPYTGTGQLRYHYFDSVEGFTSRHSFDFAYDFFKELERRGFLSVF